MLQDCHQTRLKEKGIYYATSRLHMGLYPTLTRMVYRNDIRERPVLGTRMVHVPSLEEGMLGFEEKCIIKKII
ncbi:MAG: hypothetical protein WD398_06260 [Cyclobacteriaceae bacterium]